MRVRACVNGRHNVRVPADLCDLHKVRVQVAVTSCRVARAEWREILQVSSAGHVAGGETITVTDNG